jgi:hypothetical protein
MCDYICWNRHGEEQRVNNGDGEEEHHAGSNEEAPPFINETFGNEKLYDDDVAKIATSPIPVVGSLVELMVHDAIDYDELSGRELKKLKQLLVDIKTPFHSSCSKRYMRLSGTLKLLQGAKSLDEEGLYRIARSAHWYVSQGESNS